MVTCFLPDVKCFLHFGLELLLIPFFLPNVVRFVNARSTLCVECTLWRSAPGDAERPYRRFHAERVNQVLNLTPLAFVPPNKINSVDHDFR